MSQGADKTATPPEFPSEPNLVRALLDHARGQFQYHAKQRLDSIRYYFIAYGVFAAAYFNSIGAKKPIYTVAVAVTAAFITVSFWILDFRNAQIVEINELAVAELEGQITNKYHFRHFNGVNNSEKPKQWRRYKKVMPIVFSYLLAASVAAALWPPHG
jgi:hypothetical protein